MQHLKHVGGKYRYRSGDTGLVIEVEVNYRKDARVRGIYLAVRPVTLEDDMVRWVLGAGCSLAVEPLARKNDKALASVACGLDPLVPAIAACWAGVPNSINGGEAGVAAKAAIENVLIDLRAMVAGLA